MTTKNIICIWQENSV